MTHRKYLGKNNPNYRNGNRIKGNYPCPICKKNMFREKRRSSRRCRDCYNKERAKNKKSRKEISKESYERHKEKILEQQKKRRSTPEGKRKLKEYSKRPEVIERRKINHKKRMKDVEYRKEYNKKQNERERKRRLNPEVKEKERKRQRTLEHRNRANKNRRLRKSIDKNFAIQSRLRRLIQRALVESGKGKKWKSSKYGIDYQAIIEHLKPFPKDISKYHIDHIKPLCSFDLTKPEQIKQAFAPENHQWLLAEENLKKGGKLNDKK